VSHSPGEADHAARWIGIYDPLLARETDSVQFTIEILVIGRTHNCDLMSVGLLPLRDEMPKHCRFAPAQKHLGPAHS
jgi:hypothetical protein